MTAPNIVLPDPLPFSIRKRQICDLCPGPNGKPINYAALVKFLGEEVCAVVDYKNTRLFQGEKLETIFRRLFPKKYGRLKDFEWYQEKLKELYS